MKDALGVQCARCHHRFVAGQGVPKTTCYECGGPTVTYQRHWRPPGRRQFLAVDAALSDKDLETINKLLLRGVKAVGTCAGHAPGWDPFMEFSAPLRLQEIVFPLLAWGPVSAGPGGFCGWEVTLTGTNLSRFYFRLSPHYMVWDANGAAKWWKQAVNYLEAFVVTLNQSPAWSDFHWKRRAK